MKTLLLLAMAGLPFCLPAQSQTRTPLRIYGQGCGPQLVGIFQPGKLALTVSQAPKATTGVLVLGLNAISVPLATPGCRLLVRPDLLVMIQTDASGVWKSGFPPIPPIILPVYAQGIFVQVGPTITWLASRGMKIGPQGTLRSTKEDFGNLAHRDADRDGALWAKGKLSPGVLGGSGMHGDFDVRVLGRKTGKKDSAGRTIYEMDAGNTTIPAGRTPSGQAITVSNGRFEFMSFHLRQNEHLQFVGTTVPHIFATGAIRIEGLLSVSAPMAIPDPLARKATKGQKGQAGGPGGAAGGRGGDTYSVTSGKVDGSAGGDLVYPKGHPYSTLFKGTGGAGSKANPATVKGIRYSFFDVICQQTSAGGGGGGYFDPTGKNLGGKGGSSTKNSNASSSPPKAYDFGAASKGGIGIPLQKLKIGTTQASADLFLIGGSGGGGAGTHPVGSIKSSTSYRHPGAGGSGGGGILLLKAGSALIVPKGGAVQADGASGLVTSYLKDFAPSPGGAGSGGSILFQSGDSISLLGIVSTLGGKSGMTDNSGKTGSGFTAVDALSGAAGPGFYRIEAPLLSKVSLKGTFQPATLAFNIARLRVPDHDTKSVAMSRWNDTGSLSSPSFEGYVIHAQIGATKITLSHDPKLGSKANTGPVILQVQGIRLTTTARQPIAGSETPWVTEDVSRLSDFVSQGYRFRLIFDRSLALGLPITVQSIEIQYVR